MRKLASLFVLAALLQGCATKVEGLFVKDDFQAQQIRQGGMIAGGVVAEPGKFDLQLSNTYSNMLVAAFHSEREYIKVVPASQFVAKVGGDKGYASILDQFSKADLDEATLTKIAARTKDVRYLALAKIDANTTKLGGSETDAREYKNSSGETVREPGKITKTQSRELVVTLTIYDLESHSVAFTGQVHKSRTATKEYEKNLATGIVSLVNAVKGKSDDQSFPPPEAPATREVLQSVFSGFAENLPKLGKS